MALDTIYEVVNEIVKIKDDEKLKKEYEKKLIEDFDNKLELQVKEFSSDVKSYIAKIEKWLKVKLISLNNSFELVNGLLLYNGKMSKTMPFDYSNYQEIFNDGSDILESIANILLKTPKFPKKNKDKELIYKFLVCFNTLSMIRMDIDTLENKLIESFYDIDKHLGKLELITNYNDIKVKIKENKQIIKEYFDKVLSNDKMITFSNGYNDKVFIGYSINDDYNENVSLDNSMIKETIEEFLKVDFDLSLINEPIYYKIDKDQKPIVIKHSKNLDNKKMIYFLESLLLRLILSVPLNKISFYTLNENSNREGNSDDEKIIYCSLKDINELFDNKIVENLYLNNSNNVNIINDIIDSRRSKYNSLNKYNTIKTRNNFYEYNKVHKEEQDSLIVLLISNSILKNVTFKNKLNKILDSNSEGIVTVILEESNVDSIDISEYDSYNTINNISNYQNNNYNFDYNNEKVYLKINNLDLIKKIKMNILESESFSLTKLLKKIKKDRLVYSADDKAFRIPIGISNNKVVDLVLSNDRVSHGILLGDNDRNSLLKTLILGASSLYSPEELEFYLVDYNNLENLDNLKNLESLDNQETFNVFQDNKKIIIPHIKYLYLNASSDNTMDVLDMISRLHNERMNIINSNGFSDIYYYNNSESVRKGNPKTPKLCRTCFIINNYEKMFSDNLDNSVYERLISLLNIIRSSGLFILLCGSSDNRFKEKDIRLISRKVIMKGNNIINDKAFFDNDNNVEDKNIKDLKELINKNLTNSRNFVLITNDENVYELGELGKCGSEKGTLISSIINEIQKSNKVYSLSDRIVFGNNFVNISSDNSFERETIEGLKKGYSLNIGQSLVTYEPVAIRYSSSIEDSNYFVYGSTYHTDRIKQNIILSYLYATSLKHKYNSYRVYDLNINCMKKTNSILEEFSGEQSYLSKHIKSVFDNYECAKTILNLYKKLNSKTTISEPVLLVVTGASKLRVPGVITSISNKVHDAIENKEVCEALKELYLKGHMKNIFVLLVDSSYKMLEWFISDNVNRFKFSVSDTKDITDNYEACDTNHCYVRSNRCLDDESIKEVNCMVKLYNYQGEKNQPWWRKLKDILI